MSLKSHCKICGKEIVMTPSYLRKYCSHTCYQKAVKLGLYNYVGQKKIKNRYVCSFCGKEVIAMKRKKRNGETAEHIFCDRNCYNSFRKLNSKRNCKYCGKEFEALNDKKHAQFCDDTCRRAFFAQKTMKYCVVCGQSFYPWFFDKRKGTLILKTEINTCGDKCEKLNRKNNELLRRKKISFAFTGEKHPNWQGGLSGYRGKNWTHQRFLTKIRDKFVCQKCGMTQKRSLKEFGESLEVHHIIPYREFTDYKKANDLSNLITLCKSCHQKAEWEYRKEHNEDKSNKKIIRAANCL